MLFQQEALCLSLTPRLALKFKHQLRYNIWAFACERADGISCSCLLSSLGGNSQGFFYFCSLCVDIISLGKKTMTH